ncbi:MAG: diacylglycerol kinase family lipid kinase [Armatimonadota bacterium]
MLVIINPTARLVGRSVRIGDVMEHLLRLGAQPQAALTKGKGEARALAQQAIKDGRRRIIVAGGDGTVNEVVQAIANTDLELAVIPLGTGNILGRFLGLRPGEVFDACELAVKGEAHPVDLGVMNGHYFVGMAGVGLDAEIVHKLSRPWKEAVGWLAFAGQAIQAILTEDESPMTVTFGKRTFSGPMWGIFICNLPEYSYRLELSKNAMPDDGLLDFVVLHPRSQIELLEFGLDTFVWREAADMHPAATVLQAQNVSINAEIPVRWQTDGDVMGETPVDCRVEPLALRVVRRLPEDNDDVS